jgi:hypothetical protein
MSPDTYLPGVLAAIATGVIASDVTAVAIASAICFFLLNAMFIVGFSPIPENIIPGQHMLFKVPGGVLPLTMTRR